PVRHRCRHARLRSPGRSPGPAQQGGLRLCAGGRADAGGALVHRLHLGARLAARAGVPAAAHGPELFLSVARGNAGAGRGPPRPARAVWCAAVAGDEPGRARPRADLPGFCQRPVPACISRQLAADGLLHAGAFLCRRDRPVPVACQGTQAATQGVCPMIRSTFLTVTGVAALWLAMPLAVAAEDAPLVEAPAGTMRGEMLDGVAAFRGIRYAQAPTGRLRWRPPVAADALAGVNDATRFGPACHQPPSRPDSIYAPAETPAM